MIRKILALATLFCLALPTGLRADPLPAPTSAFVNDLAGMIAPDARERITQSLRELRAQTGVQATVVTLNSRLGYDGDGSLEGFATGLFNAWGIGARDRNDGILLLVLRDDRQVRIELGTRYGHDWDWLARDVIDDTILPAFRAGDYSGGIEAGLADTLRLIARPAAQNQPPPEAPKNGWADYLMPVLMIGLIAFMALRRRISNTALRLRRCPECGQRGLTRDYRAGPHASAQCRTCDYIAPGVIAGTAATAQGNDSLGGGSSSGGGASGSW